MIPFQERKKIRRILYSKTSLVVLTAVVFSVGRGAWNIHQKAQIARSERDIAVRSLSELEARNKGLQVSLMRLKSERGIEEEVRQKYTVARPGEEIVVVVDDSLKKGKNGEVVDQMNFWQKFIIFFTAK